jgi:hypothetical protein
MQAFDRYGVQGEARVARSTYRHDLIESLLDAVRAVLGEP